MLTLTSYSNRSLAVERYTMRDNDFEVFIEEFGEASHRIDVQPKLFKDGKASFPTSY